LVELVGLGCKLVTTKVGTSDDTSALRGTVLNDGENEFHAAIGKHFAFAEVVLVLNCRGFVFPVVT